MSKTSVILSLVWLVGTFSQGHAQFSVLGTNPPKTKPVEGLVLETRDPIAKDQKPAFPGQTRAISSITKSSYKVTIVAKDLAHPWSIAFLPDGRMLISEKRGSLRIITPDGNVSDTLNGMPKVFYAVDAGLLDLEIDPDFRNNRTIYFSYVKRVGKGSLLAVGSAQLATDERSIQNFKDIIELKDEYPIPAHFGSRLLFDKEGKLLVSTGERFIDNVRKQAQWLSSDLGKILRINKDGTPAPGNPVFPDSMDARQDIWAYGLRNPQGLAFNPENGELWESEHGPQAGDEINIIEPGKNYGWPLIAYGTEYSGEPVNGGKTAMNGMQQPIYYWDPAIAPGGITFYSGNQIPEWKGNLFVSALAGQHLIRLVLDGHRVIGEERLLVDNKQRVRDVVEGPDGNLWIVTDADNGRLIKISAN